MYGGQLMASSTISRPLPCIRCHGDLPADSAFCPACGSPQLRVTETEIAAAAAALASTSTPRAPDLRTIQWPSAIIVALICGSAIGVLSSILFGVLQLLLIVWCLAGAIAAVALYTRRNPLAGLGGGVGLRIGLLSGLFGASLATLLNAIALLLERFVFRQGADIDTGLNNVVRQLTQISAQIAPDGQSNPYLNLVSGSEGHAIVLVTGAIGSFFFMLLFSMIGGAAGGHYFSIRRRRVESAAP
jgi:ribosomal protein L40E